MESPPTLTELVARIYQADDAIQSFLNSYSICKSNWTELFNLLTRENGNEEIYASAAREFYELLDNGGADFQVQEKLNAKEDTEALTMAASLLTALARHIASDQSTDLSSYSEPYITSPEFGSIPYWLALEQPGKLLKAIVKKPRDLDSLHTTLWRYHTPLRVTPATFSGCTLERVVVDHSCESLLEQRANTGQLLIAVSPISDQAEIQGQSEFCKTPVPHDLFHITEIGPLADQIDALKKVLEAAYASGVAVLVMPELRMPPELLNLVKQFLKNQIVTSENGVLLVAAGSWHTDVGKDRFNRCIVLNHLGDPMWSHDKLREFTITPENVHADPTFFAKIGVGSLGGSERIQRGTRLTFYDSILGRIAVAICIGFFSPEVEPLMQASHAGVFLVPAMTPSMKDIEDRANALVRTQHAFTFAANCGRVGGDHTSLCRWPAAGMKAAKLSRGKSLLIYRLKDSSTSEL